MFNKLCVQLGGICCIALRRDAGGQLAEATALLADARRPMGGHHDGAHHPPHVAVLQFFVDQLSPRNQLPIDLRFRRTGSDREQAAIFLERVDVELELGNLNLAQDPPPLLVSGRTDDTLPANVGEQRDFHWVADSTQLGVGGLQAGCLERELAAPPSLLARVPLRGGLLGSGRLESQGGGLVFAAEFVDRDQGGPAVLERALALWSEWERPIPDEDPNRPATSDITFVLRRFGNGAVPRKLVLSSAGIPSGSTVTVAIKNVPLADLLEVADFIDPGVAPAERGSHFELNYLLASAPPQPVLIPRLLNITDGKPHCPPTRLFVGGGD